MRHDTRHNIITALLVVGFIFSILATSVLAIYLSPWSFFTFLVSVCFWGILDSSTTKE